MAGSSVWAIATISAILGIASHLGYFIHGEHHMQAVRWATLLLTVPVVLFVYRLGDGVSYLEARYDTITITSSYLISLYSSIAIYRLLFHRLRNFPGPIGAKVTKLSHVIRLVRGQSNNYLQADRLHEHYGEIVRVGPNELSIIIPEAVPIIYGTGTKCARTAWYDVIGLPNKSLQLERDRVTHDKRRKVWDRGFSSKALRDYESRVIRYADQLVTQLKSFSGEAVDATKWLKFYSFDVMGDLAFGRSFNMLETGKEHFGLHLLKEGMATLGIVTPIPWAVPIFQALPAPDGLKQWVDFCDNQITVRKKYVPEKSDIMSWLIDAERENKDPIVSDPRWLFGDTRLVIIAGSDTSSAALTYIFYHLALESGITMRLRDELSQIYEHGSENEMAALQDAKYLNGVINEALRLHPPVPSGLLRTTPPEGIMVGGTFIPGNVTISAPTYTMGRLESCFPRPLEFLPERWGERPDLVVNKAASIPFSSGPYSCIGKQLALMELRIVTARLVMELDLSFAPGEYGKSLLEETRDVFTLEMAPLKLVFSKRSQRG